MISWFSRCFMNQTPAKAPRIIEIQWVPPPSNWLNVNTDCVVNGSTRMTGFGGIFRTYRRFCKGCFSFPLGVLYEVELIGVFCAIEFVNQYIWNYLWFKCDSIYVVNLLNSNSKMMPWRFLTLGTVQLTTWTQLFIMYHIFSEKGTKLWISWQLKPYIWHNLLGGLMLLSFVML